MIELFASEPHYLAHLLPLVGALREHANVEPRVLVTTETMRRTAHMRGAHDVAIGSPRRSEGAPVIVASHRDTTWTNNQRRIGYLEHGAGQTYRDAPKHYSGGDGFERVDLFLAPNDTVTERWQWRYPEATARTVGCPRLDAWSNREENEAYRAAAAARRGDDRVLVAFSWHWPCRRAPEAGWAWPEYREQMGHLAQDGRWALLGTAHPRAPEHVWRWYDHIGVPTTHDPDEVLAHADLLVADNTSLMYEFATLDRPVVAVRSRHWRTSVEHGLRFWSHIPGIECMDPPALVAAIAHALRTDDHRVRQVAVERAYGGWPDGRAAERAARAICETLL